MRRLWGLAIVTAMGCMVESGGPAGSSGEACADRHGLYRQHYVETNGTCGPIPDVVSNVDDPLTPGCSYDVTSTQQNCHRVGTVTCRTSSGSTSKATLTVTFTPDASHGSGTAYIQLDFCISTYALTLDAVR
jgi:hypothetical protein